MTPAEAIRRTQALLNHFNLDGWGVEVLSDTEWAQTFSNHKKYDGFCDDARSTVVLKESALANDLRAECLILHEIAHALTPDDHTHGEDWKRAVLDLWLDPNLLKWGLRVGVLTECP
jgi:hypothetical protein